MKRLDVVEFVTRNLPVGRLARHLSLDTPLSFLQLDAASNRLAAIERGVTSDGLRMTNCELLLLF